VRSAARLLSGRDYLFPLVRKHVIRSGAGKSTTVRVITGLTGPDSGRDHRQAAGPGRALIK